MAKLNSENQKTKKKSFIESATGLTLKISVLLRKRIMVASKKTLLFEIAEKSLRDSLM